MFVHKSYIVQICMIDDTHARIMYDFVTPKNTIIHTHLYEMIHRGEIVEKAVRTSGVNIVYVAEKMGHRSRSTIYRKFDDPNLPWDYIIRIYKVIKRDPVKDFPELSRYVQHKDIHTTEDHIQDHQADELEKELSSCKKEVEILNQRLADKDDLIQSLKDQLNMAKEKGYRKHA